MANFVDLIGFTVGGAFGGDWTFFAIIIMIMIAIGTFKFRLPAVVGLAAAWGIVYAFNIMPNVQSSNIDFILKLLTLAMGIVIIIGLLKYVSRGQN